MRIAQRKFSNRLLYLQQSPDRDLDALLVQFVLPNAVNRSTLFSNIRRRIITDEVQDVFREHWCVRSGEQQRYTAWRGVLFTLLSPRFSVGPVHCDCDCSGRLWEMFKRFAALDRRASTLSLDEFAAVAQVNPTCRRIVTEKPSNGACFAPPMQEFGITDRSMYAKAADSMEGLEIDASKMVARC